MTDSSSNSWSSGSNVKLLVDNKEIGTYRVNSGSEEVNIIYIQPYSECYIMATTNDCVSITNSNYSCIIVNENICNSVKTSLSISNNPYLRWIFIKRTSFEK